MKTALLFFLAAAAFAQTPQAILVDGPGPWRDANWAFTVDQFNGLLSDAGYSVTTISPADLKSGVVAPNVLLAVPSLESIPFDACQAVTSQLKAIGTLMASGGEPFRDPLYLTPDGHWLDSAAYQAALGTPPSQGPLPVPVFETLSPSYKQYTNSAGLRVPIARSRGLAASPSLYGRYRVIGDLLAPVATFYWGAPLQQPAGLIVWLPWAQLYEPLRAQFVAALHAARYGANIVTAGANQVVWLPGEDVTGQAVLYNSGGATVQAIGQWSVTGATGVTTQPPVSVALAPGAGNAGSSGAGEYKVPLDLGSLPNGDYTLTFRLTVGAEEIDRVDSLVRVLDPTLARQPDQKIKVENGGFSLGGKRIFLQGVNYWPRSVAGLEPAATSLSWLESFNYDPDVIEADLAQISALHFNQVNIQDTDLVINRTQVSRNLIDFLDRCRRYGLWVRISLRVDYFGGAYGSEDPTVGTMIDAAYLPGNDRVLCYELFWEPMLGTQTSGGAIVGRSFIDSAWRSWVNDQYGSLTNAQQIWGFAAPVDPIGQFTGPIDSQIENDGPWRVMVAAYRRFCDDYLGRNIGLYAREIHRTDPDTLLTYRDWTTMTEAYNDNFGYDIGTGAAHLDFFSPESYQGVLGWPGDRASGLVTAYSRYRTGGKPVQWAEFGYDISAGNGSQAALDQQASACDTMMRQVADDRSDAASVWWWPGGIYTSPGTSDFGIVNPDGTPRPCAQVLSQWSETFAATPPDTVPTGSTVTLTVDRDADARGSYGLFLNWQDNYVAARDAGEFVVLADQGTGTNTATMPMIQVGNAPYTGVGPLKFANAELGGIHVVCPNLDVTLENGSVAEVPAGTSCQITPTLVNTGEAQWLPATAAAGGVTLHTNSGDIPLTASVPALQRIAMGPLTIVTGQSTMIVTGRLNISGGASFGEVFNLEFAVVLASSDQCAVATGLSPVIAVPYQGATGPVGMTGAAACSWFASAAEPWVTIPFTGTGPGTAAYTVLPNPGPARQATLEVLNQAFTVTQAAAPGPTLAPAPTWSAASLNFGAETVGAVGAQSVTLTNGSAVAMNFSGITVGGLNSSDFAQTNTCGGSLAAGAGCKIVVTFDPAAAGMRTATLFVSGTIAGATPALSLSGTGVATGPAPAIQAIVDSWGYSAGIAPGLWVTIGGTNLGGAPQSWNLANVQQLPTSLGGVEVQFNGAPAALLYVSATQINALVPASINARAVQVVVQVNGLNSAPFAITATATQPAVYAPPSADGSTFFVTAALQGTAILVGNSATDSRVVRAAYPGDILDLYMIGLGATTDPSKFLTDQPFQGAFPVSAAVTATVGGENAPVIFAGLTSPGLYLVRVAIPADLPAGQLPIQLPIQVTAGAAHTRSSLVLTVATPPASLIQNGSAALRKSEVYRLQFRAKAAQAQTLRLSLGEFTGDVPVSAGWRQYTVYFRTAEGGPADLHFDLSGSVSIDGVVLQGAPRF